LNQAGFGSHERGQDIQQDGGKSKDHHSNEDILDRVLPALISQNTLRNKKTDFFHKPHSYKNGAPEVGSGAPFSGVSGGY
jgi:hypothetical protein